MDTLDQLKETNLLGICGREGAGKTTIANLLTNEYGSSYKLQRVDNKFPLDYIVYVMFGTDAQLNVDGRDPIWNLTRLEQYQVMIDLITKYVDSTWIAKHNNTPFIAPFDDTSSNSSWVEFSFATALKKVCSVLFKVSYTILLAQTESDRTAREENLYGHDFDNLPDKKPMNGRVILEYFGTDVMRNHFDKAVWIKIVERESAHAVKNGFRVVFPDIRFENEVEMINNIGGTLLLVYRKDDDLVLTDADTKTHQAKWHFLRYYPNAKKLIKFRNDKTLSELQTMIKNAVC